MSNRHYKNHYFYFLLFYFSVIPTPNRRSTLLTNLTTLHTSCKWNYAVIVLLWLAYFTSHQILKFYPCCRILQNFLLSKGGIVLHCVYRPHFLYPSGSGHWGCFHTLATVSSAASDIRGLISLRDADFSSFR